MPFKPSRIVSERRFVRAQEQLFEGSLQPRDAWYVGAERTPKGWRLTKPAGAAPLDMLGAAIDAGRDA